MPATVTDPLNVTWIATDAPARYVPLAVVDVTLVTVVGGGLIAKLLLVPSEPAVPGADSVRTAGFDAASLMAPPFSDRALIECSPDAHWSHRLPPCT